MKCEITEYGYDIWTDMLPYGEDYHQDAICQSLEEKNTQNIGKLLIFFCPQVKEERKKNEVKLVINRS